MVRCARRRQEEQEEDKNSGRTLKPIRGTVSGVLEAPYVRSCNMENQSFLPDEYDSSFLHQALRFETEVGLASLQALAISQSSRVASPDFTRQTCRATNTKITTFATFCKTCFTPLDFSIFGRRLAILTFLI